MRKDRIISLIFALLCSSAFYAAIALHPPARDRDRIGSLFVPLVFLFPLALIWFGDEMGEYRGPVSHGYITQKSPGCLVKLMGWIFLLALGGLFLCLLFFGSTPVR